MKYIKEFINGRYFFIKLISFNMILTSIITPFMPYTDNYDMLDYILVPLYAPLIWAGGSLVFLFILPMTGIIIIPLLTVKFIISYFLIKRIHDKILRSRIWWLASSLITLPYVIFSFYISMTV